MGLFLGQQLYTPKGQRPRRVLHIHVSNGTFMFRSGRACLERAATFEVESKGRGHADSDL